MKKLLQLALLFALGACAGAAFGQSCTTPFTDSFSGTGALGSQWASPISSGSSSTVTRASGTAVSSAAGIAILNNYCGVFPAAQKIASAAITVGNYSGPGVRMDSSGNGYVWLLNTNNVFIIANGSGVSPVVSSCPAVSNGDQTQISVDASFTITCKNVTTGLSATGTDGAHTYASGYPALFVWNGFPMGPVTIQGGTQAAAPTFSPAGPRLPTGGASVAISCSDGGASAFYSVDGSAPSLTYSSPVSVTSATTLKAVCKVSGDIDSDITSQTYTVGSLTWYVRPDGGSRHSAFLTTGLCDGLGDSAPVGTTPNQHCAFNDFRFLFQDGSYNASLTYPSWGWIIAGGDTVIIRGRVGDGVSYRIGWPNNTSCFTGGTPNLCFGVVGDRTYSPPAPPSGTSSAHTRILGEHYAACTNDADKAELHGGWGLGGVLDLRGTNYVDVQCIGITDFSGCGQWGQFVPCKTGGTNLEDWADNGIVIGTGTTNASLIDTKLHGLSGAGLFGPPGDNFHAQRIRILGNAHAGWDSDDHSGTPGVGNSLMEDFEISWSGCAETYPPVEPLPYWSCTDQSTGGYGDGFGSISVDSVIPWHLDFERGTVTYNTQDGLDALHLCCATSSIVENRILAYGSEGEQLKVGGANATISNSIINGNCEALTSGIAITGRPSPTHDNLAAPCRGGNTAVFVTVSPGYTTHFIGNTLYSGGAIGLEIEYANTGDTGNTNLFDYEDNVFVGFFNVGRGQNSNPIYNDVPGNLNMLTNPGSHWGHNSYFGYKAGWGCPGAGETASICVSPQLQDLNYHITGYGQVAPLAGSPVLAAGIALSGGSPDFNGTTRSAPPSIGACDTTSDCPSASVPPVSVTPVSTPADGYSGVATTLTYTCATPSSSIYTTTGGGTPGTLYTAGISVATTSTYRAQCRAAGYLDSLISSTHLTITLPQAATPSWTPSSPHTGTAAFSASMTESTGGAIVCWSPTAAPVINQSASCPVGSTLYAGSFTIGASGTYHAVAGGPGLLDSVDAPAVYTITPPPPTAPATMTLGGTVVWVISQ